MLFLNKNNFIINLIIIFFLLTFQFCKKDVNNNNPVFGELTLDYLKKNDTVFTQTTKNSTLPIISWSSNKAGTFTIYEKFGNFPTGISINSSTGIITYTNVPWGKYTLVVSAKDNATNKIKVIELKIIVQTYGIPENRSLREYEAVATNVFPYQASNTSNGFPDFSSACFVDLENASGSAVLISSQWVLTAGHNFHKGNNAPITGDINTMKISFGNNPNMPLATYQIERIIIHPDWIKGDGSFRHGKDIALVKLKVPVNPNIATPAIFNTDLNFETFGAKLWYAGFGGYFDKYPIGTERESRKHAFSNTLDRLAKDIEFKTDSNITFKGGGFLCFDFDGKNINSLGDDYLSEDKIYINLKDGINKTSSSVPLDFEAGTVSGDSGGPIFMFRESDKKWVVVGVLYGGINFSTKDNLNSDYGDISVFTRVASFKNWIDSTINSTTTNTGIFRQANQINEFKPNNNWDLKNLKWR